MHYFLLRKSDCILTVTRNYISSRAVSPSSLRVHRNSIQPNQTRWLYVGLNYQCNLKLCKMIDAGECLTMDRCDVGVVLGVVGGAYYIFQSSVSFFFAGRYIVSEFYQILAGYLVALGLAILVLFGAFLARRGLRVAGGTLMLIVSLFDLITWVILVPPFVVASLLSLYSLSHIPFGVVGGILILSSRIWTKQDKVGEH